MDRVDEANSRTLILRYAELETILRKQWSHGGLTRICGERSYDLAQSERPIQSQTSEVRIFGFNNGYTEYNTQK